MLIDEVYRRGVGYVMVDLPQKKGDPVRRHAGTVFFLRYALDNEHSITYAVTARHILDEATRIGAVGLALRVNYGHQGYRDMEMTVDQWERHPDSDVAVAKVERQPNDVNLWPYPIESLIFTDKASQPLVGEGDEVFFLGLFNRVPGKENVWPIVRFGTIALMPYEAIEVRFSNAPDAPLVPIEAYLIEARSWGGHSGSPAWVYFPMTRKTESLTYNDMKATQPMLLGLVHGHYPLDEGVDFVGDLVNAQSLATNAGIAIVVPAWRIAEVLMSEPLKNDRDELREQYKRERTTPVLDTDLDEPEGDEFERFEDKLSKLAQVPKSEVDELRRREES